MRQEHGYLPFHHIEVWEGSYFSPAQLGADIGVQIFLGHRGLPCHQQDQALIGDLDEYIDQDTGNLREFPRDADCKEPYLSADNWQSNLRNRFPDDADDDDDTTSGETPASAQEESNSARPSDGQHSAADSQDFTQTSQSLYGVAVDFVIGHTNGFHLIQVVPCCCSNHPTFDRQLLFSNLWATSYVRPKTAFTFECLSLMRDLNLECHVSANAYHTLLEKRSNLPLHVRMPNKYAELIRADRQWRNCQVMMEFGYGHSDAKPGPGAMTHFCVTCPDPDVNLPPHFQQDEHLYVY
jgi:hypothetical protein